MKQALQLVLRGYKRFISPALPHACRFVPTCSDYALEAIERHGSLRGGWLAMRRLLRCHPFGKSGLDLVPATKATADLRIAASDVECCSSICATLGSRQG
jgi:putative membrane protein insertion efficiency factor